MPLSIVIRSSLLSRVRCSGQARTLFTSTAQFVLKYSADRPSTGKTHPTNIDSNSDQLPVIKTCHGLVQGSKRATIYDEEYYGFEGIPYGQPPVGELRFKSPLPARNWNEVRNCIKSDVKPLQRNLLKETDGSEDCLYLNVYAKKLSPQSKLPVMVFIYGGAFNTGNATRDKYGPDYFMQEDVILVTFNYRLSVFGFLSFRDPALQIPGNAGLKDQLLALQWIKQNIAAFGGDPDNVTLFGESAGAASVHYLMCTERAKGLFHKAICMSGTILNYWAWTEEATDLPYALACEKGYKGPNEDQDVYKFLVNCKGTDLLEMDQLNLKAYGRGDFYTFVPSTEPYDQGDAIAAKPLLELVKESWAHEIPLIIGGTSFEGLLRYAAIKMNPKYIEQFKHAPQAMLPAQLRHDKSLEQQQQILQILLDLHFKSDSDKQQELMDFLHFFTFRGFWHDFHRLVLARKALARAPTYQYLFDFDSPTFNHHRKTFCGDDIKTGVAHADDLAYTFYSANSWKLDCNSKEYLTIKRMIKMWTQFSNNANPNCEYTADSQWKTLQETDVHHWLRISNEICFEEMPLDFRQKLEKWNELYGYKLL